MLILNQVKSEIFLICLILFTGCESFSQDKKILGKWQQVRVGTELNPISKIEYNSDIKLVESKTIEFTSNGILIDNSQGNKVKYLFADSTLVIGQRSYKVLDLTDQLLFIQDIPSKNKLFFSQYLYQKVD